MKVTFSVIVQLQTSRRIVLISSKGRYPYRDVAVLSLLLWRHHAPRVRTLLRIVHTEPALSSFMRVYGEMLERAGAVVEWVPAGDMDCVLKSQLVRSLSIHNIILSYV